VSQREASFLVPDVLAPGLHVVFCGTAPSKRSAAARAYYAHPSNRFWRTLAEVGLTPRRFQPGEYRQLLALSIGLTDLCKVHAGNDDELPGDAFDLAGLHMKMRAYQPAWIAFTSKTAGSAALGRAVTYGEQPERIGVSRCFVLPSPSGQAARCWDGAWWRAIAERVAARRDHAERVMAQGTNDTRRALL
jgi:TDG/mug DNA glycosylase family protein